MTVYVCYRTRVRSVLEKYWSRSLFRGFMEPWHKLGKKKKKEERRNESNILRYGPNKLVQFSIYHNLRAFCWSASKLIGFRDSSSVTARAKGKFLLTFHTSLFPPDMKLKRFPLNKKLYFLQWTEKAIRRIWFVSGTPRRSVLQNSDREGNQSVQPNNKKWLSSGSPWCDRQRTSDICLGGYSNHGITIPVPLGSFDGFPFN